MAKVQDYTQRMSADIQNLRHNLNSWRERVIALDAEVKRFNKEPGELSAADQPWLEKVADELSGIAREVQAFKLPETGGEQPTPGGSGINSGNTGGETPFNNSGEVGNTGTTPEEPPTRDDGTRPARPDEPTPV